jgi:hypothetical protein
MATTKKANTTTPPLDHGIVPLGDGADQDLADAGPVEDELDGDGA